MLPRIPPHRPPTAWPAIPTTVGPTTQVNSPRSFFSMAELQEGALHRLVQELAERHADQDAGGRADLAELLPQRGREHGGADEPAHDPHEPRRRPDLAHASLRARSSAPSPSISTVLRRQARPPGVLTAAPRDLPP